MGKGERLPLPPRSRDRVNSLSLRQAQDAARAEQRASGGQAGVMVEAVGIGHKRPERFWGRLQVESPVKSIFTSHAFNYTFDPEQAGPGSMVYLPSMPIPLPNVQRGLKIDPEAKIEGTLEYVSRLEINFPDGVAARVKRIEPIADPVSVVRPPTMGKRVVTGVLDMFRNMVTLVLLGLLLVWLFPNFIKSTAERAQHTPACIWLGTRLLGSFPFCPDIHLCRHPVRRHRLRTADSRWTERRHYLAGRALNVYTSGRLCACLGSGLKSGDCRAGWEVDFEPNQARMGRA